MTRILAPAALLLASLAFAQEEAAEPELDAETYAIINGEKIPFTLIQELIGTNPQVGGEQLNNILRRFVSGIVMAQEARRLNYHQNEEYLERLEQLKARIAFRSFAQEMGPSVEVSDEEVKARYDRAIEERAGTLEYDSFHILTDTEEEARDLLAQAGGDLDEFMKLARTHSTDTGSGASGGYLGWSITASFVPEFGAAVAAIEPGGFSAEPVQSQFGWHIIHVRDRREMTMPEFTPAEAEQIKRQLQYERANDEARKLLVEYGDEEDLAVIDQPGGPAFAAALGKAALASGRYNESESFKSMQQLAEYQLLPSYFAAQLVDQQPITEEAIQERYDVIAAERENDVEHRMYQLVFPSKEAANQALESLAGKPEDFKEMASLNGGDAEENDNDLGWVHPTTYPVEAVALLADELADGEIAPEPIRTQNGWALLYRDATQPYELPPLDEKNRELIIRTLKDDLIQDAVIELMEKADILINNADGAGGSS